MTILHDDQMAVRYGPPPRLGVHPEGGGFTATCACQWLVWSAFQSDAHNELRKHEKTCKAIKEAAA